MDLRLRRHDGEYRWMLDNGVPRLGADGAAIGFVGSCVDIHERKELEESLAERTQALRLAERRQGQFLAMLSHELRNPLAPIANAASVLRTLEHSNPILVRLREILERQVARLGRLVEELIDVDARRPGPDLAGARAGVDRERRPGGGRGAATTSSPPAAIGSTSTSPTSACTSAATAAGWPRRSRNLITTPPSSRSSRARSRSACGAPAQTVQIAVKDHGRRASTPTFLPHAFELFAQQDQTLARTLGGLGVGLTLARRIAQLHGGDVEGFSEGPGRGGEFVLWLPLLDAGGGRRTSRRRRCRAERELPRPDRRGQRRRAREPAPADGALGQRGHAPPATPRRRSTPAARFRAADRPLRHRPAGHGRLQPGRARCARSWTGMPVVFAAVTGYASADDQQRALAAGFDSFLVKPLNPAAWPACCAPYPARGA